MENNTNNNLLDGSYKFSDIVDIPRLTEIFEKFSKATGFTIGLIDNNSLEVLIKTGWHDICVNFHRANEKASEVCKKSNKILFSDLEDEKSIKIVTCEHGLYDCATPIIIEGKHIANLATGQLLMQKPDISRFKQQAKDFDFDEQAYLKALLEVPVANREKVTEIMDYLSEFSMYIAKEGLNNLRTNKLNKELILAKQNAEKSENKLRNVINAIPDLFFMKDINGVYLDCNKSFTKLVGRKATEIIGKTDYQIFPKEMADFFTQKDTKMLKSGKPKQNDEWVTYPDESRKFLNTSKTPYYDISEKPQGIIGISRDITIRNKNEQELIKAKRMAEESDRLKTEFIHNLSHEIRTPMNGILGFSDCLNDKDLSDKDRIEYINIIQSSGSQLMRVIDDILEISILDTMQVETIEKETCLNDLFSEQFSVFNISAKEKKTDLYLNLNNGLSDKESTIYTDETKLIKILSNLLENALKFTIEGFIEFGYKRVNNEIEIYVKDSGIGINPENYENIFKRFSQEERDLTRNVGGIGLGLSIAKENAELLGGGITLISEKGKGSTFFVTIPYKAVIPK